MNNFNLEIGQGSRLKQTLAAENERCAFKLYTYFFEQGSKISKKFVNLHGKTKIYLLKNTLLKNAFHRPTQY